jgi:hypothetical protein
VNDDVPRCVREGFGLSLLYDGGCQGHISLDS